MTNYLIIHGLAGKPFENWIPWLERSLSEGGLRVTVPQFPTPEMQSYSNWSKLLDYYVAIGYVNENTIAISHSIGSVFIAKYIVENKLNIRGLVSISGFNRYVSGMEDMDVLNASFFVEDNQLGQVKRYAKSIHCIYSMNDPFLPKPKLMEYASQIGGELHVFENGGHFNTAAGYEKFKELLDIVRGGFGQPRLG